jgi:hypothetical protein
MTARVRKLISVDLENMLGGSMSTASAQEVSACYINLRTAIGTTDLDHVVIGVHPRWAFLARSVDASARIVTRPGRDGAELRLIEALEDVTFLRRRYDEVVIASGDHRFLETIMSLNDAGVPTVVAGYYGAVAKVLQLAARHLVWLPSAGLHLPRADQARGSHVVATRAHQSGAAVAIPPQAEMA